MKLFKTHFSIIVALSAILFWSMIFVSCKETPTVQEILSNMTTEEKVAQLFVIRVEQIDSTLTPEQAHDYYEYGRTALSGEMKKMLAQYPVGGFCIFGKNIQNRSQLKKLNRDLKRACTIPPILSVDEEGGPIARLAKTKSLGIKNVEPMEEIGKTGDVSKAYQTGSYIGKYLSNFGFNMDFAPVADINTNPENIVIGNRSFGSDPELVAGMDKAFLEGLHSKNIKGSLKHFPGHGDTSGDTHSDYVAVTKSWDELLRAEIIPFQKNFNLADTIMIAHVTCTQIDDVYPASLSKILVTEKLREELGYKGVILSDSLAMGAIEKNYGSAEACILAFEAGNDILLMPQDFVEAYNGVLAAVQSGRIPMERLDESVLRILKLKGF